MKKTKGFTLIELLVVIAVIALLLAIIVPSLKLAKQKAASVICLTDAKNLSLGWVSYAEDNDSRIMSSCMGGTTDPYDSAIGAYSVAALGNVPPWIGQPRKADGTLLSAQSTNIVTDEDEIRGIEAGALHPYLKAPKVFNCPADKVKALDKYDTVDPEKFVTFAIPDCLAGYETISKLGATEGPRRRITRLNEIKTPSERYNFVETAEERNYTVHGHFVFGAREVNGNNPEVWWGPMAVNHGAASVLGFCDGHAELHKWQDKYTKERVAKLSRLGVDSYNIDTSGPNSTNSLDILYMAKGWPYRYK